MMEEGVRVRASEQANDDPIDRSMLECLVRVPDDSNAWPSIDRYSLEILIVGVVLSL